MHVNNWHFDSICKNLLELMEFVKIWSIEFKIHTEYWNCRKKEWTLQCWKFIMNIVIWYNDGIILPCNFCNLFRVFQNNESGMAKGLMHNYYCVVHHNKSKLKKFQKFKCFSLGFSIWRRADCRVWMAIYFSSASAEYLFYLRNTE